MKHRTLLAVLLAVASLPTAALAAPPATVPGRADRVCGTADPTPAERNAARAALSRVRGEARVRASGGTIGVAVHVLTNGAEGAVSNAQIADQIRELNRNYGGTGFRFELRSVDRTDNRSWFKMLPGTGAERHAKEALAIDPRHTPNLYTASPGQGYLGWATFPFSGPEDHFLHGVVVHYGSLPGGFISDYNLGRTASHEIGHYLGLFHTFQGGCEAPGDEVDDTPFEASPAFGCPVGRNTCPAEGLDPIHNYMDYTDDACLEEFTAGQESRMIEMVAAYRPSLFGGAIAQSAPAATGPVASAMRGGVTFRGAFPNPFDESTVLRFTLPASSAVSLKVYDVAGKLVATLIDGRLPEGEHSALLGGRDVAPGIYFAALRVGGETISRSLVRVR